jgi:hypothetical protein
MLTSSGKKAIRNVMVARDSCPVPSITTRIGAIAMIGVDCVISSSG